ncbi:MAG: hypothetical protein GYA62_12905 [Bacteroidales bacterium]|nr:hypothetical protein [Bacteroidales bacterium]
MTKKQIKKLDELWSFAVKERDGFKCKFPNCKTDKYLNAHHIVKRQFKSLRWDLDNGITLCSGHHTFKNNSAHVDEINFLKILKGLKINYNKLYKRRFEQNNFDYNDILQKLLEQAKEKKLIESIKKIEKCIK